MTANGDPGRLRAGASLGFGVAIGIAIGAALGAAMENMGGNRAGRKEGKVALCISARRLDLLCGDNWRNGRMGKIPMRHCSRFAEVVPSTPVL